MKAMPSVQYKPAVLPPAIMLVNLARSSAVGNFVHSMMTISLKGSYLIVTGFSFSMGFGSPYIMAFTYILTG